RLRSDGRADAGSLGHPGLRPTAGVGPNSLGGARRDGAGEAPPVPGRHPRRPGHEGRVPLVTASPRALLRRLRSIGTAARAPDARGVRPRLLVHPDLRRGAPPSSRRGASLMALLLGSWMLLLAGGSAPLSVELDRSMVPACRKVLAADPSVIPELARH